MLLFSAPNLFSFLLQIIKNTKIEYQNDYFLSHYSSNLILNYRIIVR